MSHGLCLNNKFAQCDSFISCNKIFMNALFISEEHNVYFQEKTYLWRTSLYLAASASAEFFADIALCPMEAVKVRIQTSPGWATTLREGVPKLFQAEGYWG